MDIKTLKDWWFDSSACIGEKAQKEFERIQENKKFHHYVVGNVSDNYVNVWNLYGDYENGRLIMELNNGNDLYYGACNQAVVYPYMIDRKFIIDGADAKYAEFLSDMMAAVYTEKKTEEEVLKLWELLGRVKSKHQKQ
jgi:hypothetical protein